MRITIATVGSRGDVEPYIALGLGLQRAAHEVCLATHANYETIIRGRGLAFHTLEGNPREVLESDQGQDWLRSGSNPFSFMSRLSGIMRPLAVRMLSDAHNACRDADVVVGSILGVLATYHVVEKFGTPAVGAFLQPATATCAFPSPSFPASIPLGGLYNRLTYPVGEHLLWRLLRKPLDEARVEVLGLPPMSKSMFADARKRRVPILYGYSPSVLPKPSDWGDWLHVTGYWFLDPPPDWRAPADLVDFLASGPPPVYVGFGSMNDRNQERNTEIVLQALSMARCRGLLLTGWGGLSNADLPDDVFKVEEVPHRWLFPQMAAVVHHAGAGTMAAGLRAGVPMISVPYFGDQPFWAHQAYKLGVGPKPIPRKRLSAERLADAIRVALNDAGIRARAAELGERVRSENGVAQAAEAFDRLSAQQCGLIPRYPG